MSNTYEVWKYQKFEAENCIDGIIDFRKVDEFNMCHTWGAQAPWLALDFGEKTRVSVERVLLWNRKDNHYDRTRNVRIRLADKLPTTDGEEFRDGDLLGTFPGPATRSEKVEISSALGWENKFGRFLVIQTNVGREEKTYLNFKEVEAFGLYQPTRCVEEFC